MKYIKLFENYNYYFSINQNEFDNLLVSPDLYCFTKNDKETIIKHLKKYQYSVEWCDAEIFSNKEKYDQNAYFLISDKWDLDKSLHFNQVKIHKSNDKIQVINPEDFYTKYESGIVKIVDFSMKVRFSETVDNVLYINKVFDEWFLVCDQYETYKCDQLDGLLKFIEYKYESYKII